MQTPATRSQALTGPAATDSTLRIPVATGLILLLLLAVLAAHSCSPGEPAPPEINRLVLVTIDTLRADHLQLYGYPRATAPFITTLGREGAVFEHCYTASSHTGPSHATLFTSRYPFQHGLLRNGQSLAEGVPTIAEVLRQKGFATGGFCSVLFLKTLSNGFDAFRHGGKVTIDGVRYRHLPGGRLVNRAKQWAEKRSPDEKIFIWLHFFDVHEWPNDYPIYRRYEELVQRESELSGRALARRLVNQHATLPGKYNDEYYRHFPETGWPEEPPELIQRIDAYDGRIRYVDAMLARLYEVLEGERFQGNGIWIITSDHGEGLGAHDYLGHGRQLYREQLHVPLVLHFTDGFAAGRHVGHLVRSVDVFPTVLDLLGATVPDRAAPLEGCSMLPLLRGRPGDFPVQFAFSERRPADQGRSGAGWAPGKVYALQDLRHKYIFNSSTADEFYDLDRDPKEAWSLAAEDPPEMERMKARLAAMPLKLRRAEEKRHRQEDAPKMDEEVTEELEALGYIH